MKGRHKGLLDYFVWAVLLLALLYDTYRYPFRINSTATSPSYADTPTWLSAGKYLIVAGLVSFFVLGLCASRRKVALTRPWYGLLYLYLCTASAIYGIAIQSLLVMESGFFFVIPLMLHLASGRRIGVGFCVRFLVAATVLAIVSDALQVAAFLLWGRLPALAFHNSVLVRFGGCWDDPNGFGLFLALLIPFAARHWRRSIARVPVIIALGACLLLTQSMTAIVAVSASLSALGALRLASRWRVRWSTLAVGTASCIVLVAVTYWNWSLLRDFVEDYLEIRALSVTAHAGGTVGRLKQLSAVSLLGLYPFAPATESGYVNMLASCGVLYVLSFLAVALGGVVAYGYRLMRDVDDRGNRGFLSGAFCFLVATVLATCNLPVDRIFPINAFVCLLLGLSSSRAVIFVTSPTGTSGRLADEKS